MALPSFSSAVSSTSSSSPWLTVTGVRGLQSTRQPINLTRKNLNPQPEYTRVFQCSTMIMEPPAEPGGHRCTRVCQSRIVAHSGCPQHLTAKFVVRRILGSSRRRGELLQDSPHRTVMCTLYVRISALPKPIHCIKRSHCSGRGVLKRQTWGNPGTQS